MTVGYVDVVLHRNDAAQWKAVGERVNMRVEGLANVSISSVRKALLIGTEVFDRGGNVAIDTAKRRRMMTGVAEGVLTQEIGKIHDLDVKGWELLERTLQGTSTSAVRILATFDTRHEPDLTYGIITLQDVIVKVLSSSPIFPDIFGVTSNDLPTRHGGSSSIPIQQKLYANAEIDLRQLLSITAGLLRTLEGNTASRHSPA